MLIYSIYAKAYSENVLILSLRIPTASQDDCINFVFFVVFIKKVMLLISRLQNWVFQTVFATHSKIQIYFSWYVLPVENYDLTFQLML